MIRILRTNSENKDFINLVNKLDIDLELRDGKEHSFYAQFNKIARIKYVVVAFENENPVSCGALKEYDEESVEIKRMYTIPEIRGKGIARIILNELENWATELSFKKCILETGIKQPEAIKLYQKCCYERIENYGQYAAIKNSLCFEKQLKNI